MAFANPNTGPKYNLTTLKDKIKIDSVFAKDFTEQLKRAQEGNVIAIDCVESYVELLDTDLQNLGIHRSRWNSLRKCTDLGLLVHVIVEDHSSTTP